MFPKTRLRRLRESLKVRALVEETRLSLGQLIWPCFVVPGENVREPIVSLPGQYHYSVDMLAKESREVVQEEIGGLLLFGVLNREEKDRYATQGISGDSLVCRAVRAIKEVAPECLVITDVCLCGYTDHGHCGIIDEKGKIQNDATLELLSRMALEHTKAGADMVAPSDMMDGRIGAIRHQLDEHGFKDTPIMSYSAKYASSFYGPFRDAAHSAPAFGDRRSYQMNPPNVREALREIEEDIQEGADIVMIKPALPYLDVIAKARQSFDLPIAAYQVSGEYAMIRLASKQGLLDEREAVRESLLAIRRAGADILITYFARLNDACPPSVGRGGQARQFANEFK